MTLSVIGGNSYVSEFLSSRSLLLRDNSATYLTRTPSVTGNRQKFTFSLWMKRGTIISGIDYQRILTAYGAGGDEAFRYGELNRFEYFASNGAYIHRSTSSGILLTPESWYHIVFAFDSTQATATSRTRVYVNGVEYGMSVTTTAVPQNFLSGINLSGAGNRISTLTPENLDAAIAEVYLIDGQALTPFSFAKTDANGNHVPIKYTGTYGTNGFYLNFSNATSTTTLGYDYSGNNNHLSVSGASLSGLTYSASNDVPTPTSDTKGNYSVLSRINSVSGSFPYAAGMILPSSSNNYTTIGMPKGKWYWEVSSVGGVTTAGIRHQDGTVANTTVGSGLTYGFTYDVDANVFRYTTDGTNYTTVASTAKTDYVTYVVTDSAATAHLNHGQLPFTYSVPVGYLTINASNIQYITKFPSSTFLGTSYTGTGGTTTITTKFTPAFALIRRRATSTYPMVLVNSAVGNTKYFELNATSAGITPSTTTFGAFQFTSQGITLTENSLYGNTSGVGHDAFIFKKSSTLGIDAISYTGTGANTTVSHSLGVSPEFVIIKNRNATGDWVVWHKGLTGGEYLLLNSTAGKVSDTTMWNNTAPTSSVINLGTNTLVNTNGDTYDAYIFSSVPGFSKVGSYTGTGSASTASAPYIPCGFFPKLVIIKGRTVTSNWTFNIFERYHTTSSYSTGFVLGLYATGFKVYSSTADWNTNGVVYDYIAFAEAPIRNAKTRY